MSFISKIILLAIISSSAMAAGITGLSGSQINDFDYCLNRTMNSNYNYINQVQNSADQLNYGGNLQSRLFHNFSQSTSYSAYYDLNGSVLVAGLLTVYSRVNLNNSVIANMTLGGNVSATSFYGACIVNTAVPYSEYRRISGEAAFLHNVSVY